MGIIWTTTDDPSNSWSNHWSNAPKPDEGQCDNCLSYDTFETPKADHKYCCKKCWNKFD